MADTRDSKQIDQLQKPEAGHQETIAALKELMPQAFKEGKLDVEALREEVQLADELYEPSNTGEHYGLSWAGKGQAKKLATLAPSGTLHPAPGEGLDEDNTKNLIIEGDNLEVLRILQKSYAGRVKMIYIDPPYNTGSDFIYEDDFKEPVETYLQRSGQADEEGLLVSNPKASGRYHSNWLSMMYPRLRLARSLLREDGVIFVSIGDDEVQNLRTLMDEIFGEENFIGCANRVTKKSNNKGEFWAPNVDYVLTYAKAKEMTKSFFGGANYDAYDLIEAEGPRKDERYQLVRLYMSTIQNRNPEQRFYVECPDGSKVIPPGTTFPPERPNLGDGIWRWTRKKFEEEKDKIVVKKVRSSNLIDEEGNQANWNVFTKTYLNDVIENASAKPNSLIEEFINQQGSHEVKALSIPFSYAKPLGLIKYLLEVSRSETDDIVLDFFAGSGTTAHSVMKLNAEDGGNRKYILVQLPEEVDESSEAAKAGYSTIAEIAKERVRRASAKTREEHPDYKGDLGFRVLKLGRSNIKRWQPETISSIEQIALQFEQHAEQSFVNDWTLESLVTEVMLAEGYPLDSDVSTAQEFSENTVFRIEHPKPLPLLLVCLDDSLSEQTLDALEAYPDDIFVCREDALTDETKLRLRDIVRRVKTL